MSGELKPCPFCGGEPILTEHPPHTHSDALRQALGIADHPGSWTVECCDVGMIKPTQAEVVAAWNRRAPDEALQQALQQALAERDEALKEGSPCQPCADRGPHPVLTSGSEPSAAWRPICEYEPEFGVVETFGCLHDVRGAFGEEPDVQRSWRTKFGFVSLEWGSHEPVFFRPSPDGAEMTADEAAYDAMIAAQATAREREARTLVTASDESEGSWDALQWKSRALKAEAELDGMKEALNREAVVGLLRAIVEEDHSRGCEGRCYACECGYDEGILKKAAELLALLSPKGSEGSSVAESADCALTRGSSGDAQCKSEAILANVREEIREEVAYALDLAHAARASTPAFDVEFENEDGWSDWIHPLPGYRLQCCDCGLIHKMEFAIVPPLGDGAPLNQGEGEGGVIVFRASREDGATERQPRRPKGSERSDDAQVEGESSRDVLLPSTTETKEREL